jgi:hypothetical protein
VRTLAYVRKLRTLLTAIRNKTLIPTPPFQRRLVWTQKDKRNFLSTVIEGLPFPEIFIAAGNVNTITGEGTEMLVDGQQRLSTLYQYFSGSPELKLGKEFPAYSELSEQQKQDFLEYDVVVRDLGLMSREEMVSIFALINSTSYPANAMEIHNARYAGEFMQFGIEVAQDSFFERHKVFSAAEIRRMSDVAFTLTFIITIMSTYFNRDDELESYLRTYNDEFDTKSEIMREIDSVLSFVLSCGFEEKSRVWKKSDLLTLLVEVHRALNRHHLQLDPYCVGERLRAFYHKVDTFSEIDFTHEPPREYEIIGKYARAAVQGTNDRSSRILRGEIVYELIQNCASADEMREPSSHSREQASP